jgi:hypothetical protein
MDSPCRAYGVLVFAAILLLLLLKCYLLFEFMLYSINLVMMRTEMNSVTHTHK